uniref:Cytochrome b5 n=1 Tax=Anthurium amnicola TaxID=1678845 RepID=A0A1D1XKU4_9ARAE
MEELKKIPNSEVRNHTSRNDCWLVIHGKVYDVTKFLDVHPGGHEIMLHASGSGDATQKFEDVGHSSSARKRMENYLIGVVEGYNPSEAPEPRKSSGTKAKAARGKPTIHFSDYLLPLFFLVVAVGGWFVIE